MLGFYTAHEARPGHGMQYAALVENGTSLARSTYAFNSANVEGWGLYAEAIMMEHMPLEGQLMRCYLCDRYAPGKNGGPSRT